MLHTSPAFRIIIEWCLRSWPVVMGVYEVEHIVDQWKLGGKDEYFIHWKDYSTAENTWEPAAHLAEDLVAACEKRSVDPVRADECRERLTLVFENAFRTPRSAVPRKLSPSQRPLCIVGRLLCCGEAGEKEKESARGAMGRGKREERPLPYNVRLSCQICGSLTMAEAGEDLADFECSFKDLSLEG